MIALHDKKMFFVHIPRTSGAALLSALFEASSDSEYLQGIHLSAGQMLNLFPEYGTFSIVRNPWDIIESMWRRGIYIINNPHKFQWLPPDNLQNLKITLSGSFDDYIHIVLGYYSQGFYRYFCLPSTICFRYEDEPYKAIGKLLGYDLQMERKNQSLVDRPVWTQYGVNMVKDTCRLDLQLFGYTRT